MAKFCLQCGAQLREGAAFCNVCGATVRQKVQTADRTRTANIVGIRKIMTGLIAGFTFMIPFSALNSVVEEVTYDSPLSYLPIIAGVILLIVGIIIAATGRKQPVYANNNIPPQGRR